MNCKRDIRGEKPFEFDEDGGVFHIDVLLVLQSQLMRRLVAAIALGRGLIKTTAKL